MSMPFSRPARRIMDPAHGLFVLAGLFLLSALACNAAGPRKKDAGGSSKSTAWLPLADYAGENLRFLGWQGVLPVLRSQGDDMPFTPGPGGTGKPVEGLQAESPAPGRNVIEDGVPAGGFPRLRLETIADPSALRKLREGLEKHPESPGTAVATTLFLHCVTGVEDSARISGPLKRFVTPYPGEAQYHLQEPELKWASLSPDGSRMFVELALNGTSEFFLFKNSSGP